MIRTYTIETSAADEAALNFAFVSDQLDFSFNSVLVSVVNGARYKMLEAERARARETGEFVSPNEDDAILNAKLTDADTRNAEHLAKLAQEQADREAAAKDGPLTARQLRLGLVNNGFALAQVEAAIDALPDGADKEKARIEWRYAGEFRRDHPLIAAIAAQLGIAPEQLENMWREAHSL